MAETQMSAMQKSSGSSSDEPVLAQSEVFSLDKLPVRSMPNGGKSWYILHGTLATGETIVMHESTQPAGTPPNRDAWIEKCGHDTGALFCDCN